MKIPRFAIRISFFAILAVPVVSSGEHYQTSWISTLQGQRHGGGAALRIFNAGVATTSQPAGSRDDIRPVDPPPQQSSKNFDALADAALAAMQKRAAELKSGGVAVVAYFEGPGIHSWTSKMVVVDRMKDAPSAGNPGANLLAIAYAKAAEMADTLQDSGSATRPPLTGEFGWQGGVIAPARNGYVIAAFSGGKSEDDVQISRSGLAVLQHGLWALCQGRVP